MSDRIMVSKTKDLILAKSNWSEFEAKLMNTFIKELDSVNDKYFNKITLSLSYIETLWGVKLNISRLRALCHKLMQRTYEIPIFRENTEVIVGYKYYAIFDTMLFNTDTQIFEGKFSSGIKPFVLELKKNFISYPLGNILCYKSKYSFLFYEFFIFRLRKHGEISIFLTIDYLREWLMLEKKYPKIGDFKLYVLDAMEKDINEHSDLEVSFKARKISRKTVGYDFEFIANYKHFLPSKYKKYTQYIGKIIKKDGQVYKVHYIEKLKDGTYKVRFIDEKNNENGISIIDDLKNLSQAFKDKNKLT